MSNKISFCTVCMNRLHHLQKTLPQNIKDSLSYPDLEFIVMDYSSSDGLQEWIMNEMYGYVEKGMLTYYRYDQADYFDRSHSRNLMFKLASGDIICNVDSDNFLGKNFAEYIHSVFASEKDFFLVPDTKRRYYYIRDALGRFCARKSDFLAIRGYDEKMSGYGFEDDDLYDRLMDTGKREMIIRDLRFLHSIKHGNEERIGNEFFTNYFESLYIYYESTWRSDVILLYKDGSFHKGFTLPNQTHTPAPAILENLRWDTGSWKKENGNIQLTSPDGSTKLVYKDHGRYITENDRIYYKIQDERFREKLPYDLPLITNYGHFLYNKQNRGKINEGGFGQGKVFKNFSQIEIEVN